MQGLTDRQIDRQDYVDNKIFELIQKLNPTLEEVEWNIEIIAEVRDVIEQYFVEKRMCDSYTFYPYTEE